jgi:hypothetical protein
MIIYLIIIISIIYQNANSVKIAWSANLAIDKQLRPSSSWGIIYNTTESGWWFHHPQNHEFIAIITSLKSNNDWKTMKLTTSFSNPGRVVLAPKIVALRHLVAVYGLSLPRSFFQCNPTCCSLRSIQLFHVFDRN